MYSHINTIAQLTAVHALKMDATKAAAAVTGRDAAALLKKVDAEFEAARKAAEAINDYINAAR